MINIFKFVTGFLFVELELTGVHFCTPVMRLGGWVVEIVRDKHSDSRAKIVQEVEWVAKNYKPSL